MLRGWHISTGHAQPGLQGVNPGRYWHAAGLAWGWYCNSHGRLSQHAGVTRRLGLFTLGVGLVTGYPGWWPVLPYVSISWLVAPGCRLTYLPPTPLNGAALHMSYEV